MRFRYRGFGELPIAALRQAHRPHSQPDLMIDSAYHHASILAVWRHSQTLGSRLSPSNERSHTRQDNPDLCEFAGFCVDLDGSRMLLHDDVMTDRKAKPGALASRLGREEGIEHLLTY